MKKINKILTVALAAGIFGGSLTVAGLAPRKSAEAKADAPSYQTYVPIKDGWVERGAGDIGDFAHLRRGRNDRFWDSGDSDFNKQYRTYNAVDEFFDSCKPDGNGWAGNYRTPELTLYDDAHRYICFNFSGIDNGEIFFNIWNITRSFDVPSLKEVRPVFAETPNGSFDDNLANETYKYGQMTCNQIFRYYELPSGDEGIKVGEKFLVFVHDGSTGGFGFFTFGGLYINQTLNDVAKHFSAHKTQMKLNKDLNTSAWNNNAIDYVLNYYATDSFYSAVRAEEANVNSVDDGFEVNTQISNWAYDQKNSTYDNGDLASVNFGYMYSDKEYKWGGYFFDNDGLMPINKTDNKFLTGEPSDVDSYNTGLPESAKYRFVSPEFTLSGKGIISAKIGGHYAKFSLLDANYNVIATTGTGEDQLYNPAFVDADMTNIFTSGARMCTMTRFYLDCSKYLGDRVHVAIEDAKVGGGWGLAYFDEVVTYYEDVPTFTLDSIYQTHPNSEARDYGVITSKMIRASSEEGKFIPEFKEAFDFVEEYYAAARSAAKGYSWCQVQDLSDLEEDYNDLSDEAKELVDASEDFYYLPNHQVSLEYTIGQSMYAIITGSYPVVNNPVLFSTLTEKGTSYAIVIIVATALTISGLLFFVIKKRKKQ